jgi:hypothetical protein
MPDDIKYIGVQTLTSWCPPNIKWRLSRTNKIVASQMKLDKIMLFAQACNFRTPQKFCKETKIKLVNMTLTIAMNQ